MRVVVACDAVQRSITSRSKQSSVTASKTMHPLTRTTRCISIRYRRGSRWAQSW